MSETEEIEQGLAEFTLDTNEKVEKLLGKLKSILLSLSERGQLSDTRYFDDIETILNNRIRFSICFVGESGAGKSTLISALLFPKPPNQTWVPILPESNRVHKSVTAIPVEIFSTNDQGFTVKIFLKEKEDWEKERIELLTELSNNETSFTDKQRITDQLTPLYGELIDDRIQELLKKEDPKIEKLWDSSRCYHFLQGPFPSLPQGVQLVDLPGVMDVNVTRRNIALAYYKRCHYIFLVNREGNRLSATNEKWAKTLCRDNLLETMGEIFTCCDDDLTEEEINIKKEEVIEFYNTAVSGIVNDKTKATVTNNINRMAIFSVGNLRPKRRAPFKIDNLLQYLKGIGQAQGVFDAARLKETHKLIQSFLLSIEQIQQTTPDPNTLDEAKIFMNAKADLIQEINNLKLKAIISKIRRVVDTIHGNSLKPLFRHKGIWIISADTKSYDRKYFPDKPNINLNMFCVSQLIDSLHPKITEFTLRAHTLLRVYLLLLNENEDVIQNEIYQFTCLSRGLEQLLSKHFREKMEYRQFKGNANSLRASFYESIKNILSETLTRLITEIDERYNYVFHRLGICRGQHDPVLMLNAQLDPQVRASIEDLRRAE